jgi:DNA polymerase V
MCGSADTTRRTRPVIADPSQQRIVLSAACFAAQCRTCRLPPPADDYVEQHLSLDKHLIQRRESTFFLRVAGDSMRGRGIFDGDVLVVDRALPVTHGCVVIAVLDGEFTVKQLLNTPDGQVLRAAHPAYPDRHTKLEQDLSIWG